MIYALFNIQYYYKVYFENTSNIIKALCVLILHVCYCFKAIV